MNLHDIFYNLDLPRDVNLNLKEAKETHQKKLIPLIDEEGSPNSPFIYVSLKWESDGYRYKIDVNRDRIIVKSPQDSFFSLYIMCIFSQLWYCSSARWRELEFEKITASQLAFVCGLVRYLLWFKMVLYVLEGVWILTDHDIITRSSTYVQTACKKSLRRKWKHRDIASG